MAFDAPAVIRIVRIPFHVVVGVVDKDEAHSPFNEPPCHQHALTDVVAISPDNKIIAGVIFLFFSNSLLAQDISEEQGRFPYGEGLIKLYANFHSGICNSDDRMAFEVSRAYLGYTYYLSEVFSSKVLLDIGSSSEGPPDIDIGRHAFFKNAYIRYNKNALQVNFGMIDMLSFNLPENVWDHRYIMKSFQDQYLFNPSADLGANIICKASDLISFDLTVSNGEGFKNLQGDNTLKGGAGITVFPSGYFTARIYYDISVKSRHQSFISAFVSFNLKDKFILGTEYNHQFNFHYLDNYNRNGISVYSLYNINSRFQMFGRYDLLASNKLNSEAEDWDVDNDGSALVAGVQYRILKQLRAALNYQGWLPTSDDKTDLSYIYLNLEVSL